VGTVTLYGEIKTDNGRRYVRVDLVQPGRDHLQDKRGCPTQLQNAIESAPGWAAAQRACVRAILALAYCMLHRASSPAVYSLPSQGVPQI